MRLEFYIRSLARSPYWQEIYRSSKECSGVHLFDNNTNISGPQYIMLYWSRVYDLLYTELSQKMWPVLDLDVIKDDCRCDAFLYWRKKEIDKQNHNIKKQEKKHKNKKGMREFSLYKDVKK